MIPLKSLSALFVVVFCLRCSSTSVPDVSCYIVNLEKVNCSWNCVENFNFSHKFGSRSSFNDCSVYTYRDICRAGCIFPMETPHLRFSPLSTILSNGSTQRTQTHELKNAVKLNPPQNVTVQWSNSTGDVRLLWALGKLIKEQCVETHFSFRRGEGPWQDPYPISNNYQFPVSQTRRYQFRVRHRYNNNCGESYWSDWSETVTWGPIKPPQESGNSEKSKQAKDLRGLYIAIGLVAVFIILAVLTRLLLDCERIKVILVPVGPDPAKKLNDLFLEYRGNVEGWVRISPQLRDAFDPDYTESTCEVTGDDPTGCVVDE